jgi:hypothetical protein
LSIVFVHPLAGLAFAAVLLPLAAFWVVRRRAARVRLALGLAPPPRRSAVLAAAAIVALAALVGIAAAQPVALGSEPRLVRTDAEAYFVFDITRSMLASAGPDEPDRLQRARALAREIRGAVPDVPAGIASFTNRLVPHIFPTVDRALFASGLDRSLAIERPAPDRGAGALLTAFDALAPLQTHNFFSPDATRRVAIVLTDGESQPVSQDTLRALRADPPLELLLVRVWGGDERIHRPRIPFDARYSPDPASAATLTAFADAAGARVFGEDDAGAVGAELRRLLGAGEPVVVGEEVSEEPLAAWVLALGLVPLGYLLVRRNVV